MVRDCLPITSQGRENLSRRRKCSMVWSIICNCTLQNWRPYNAWQAFMVLLHARASWYMQCKHWNMLQLTYVGKEILHMLNPVEFAACFDTGVSVSKTTSRMLMRLTSRDSIFVSSHFWSFFISLIQQYVLISKWVQAALKGRQQNLLFVSHVHSFILIDHL